MKRAGSKRTVSAAGRATESMTVKRSTEAPITVVAQAQWSLMMREPALWLGGVSLDGIIGFYLLLRSGLSRHLASDPSLTLPQSFFGVVTILAFDEPLAERLGHEHSTNPANRFTHRQAAVDVFDLLDKLGIDRFSAMGISSGGMTLLHMATSQPTRVKSMVLVSATSRFTDQARTIFRETSFERMPRHVQEMYRESATRGDAQIRQLVEQFKAFHDNHDDMNSSAAELSTIVARTLIVHGDRDRFFPVEIAMDIHRSIPDAALWIVPGGNHVPIYEPTAPFTSTALQFLDQRN